MQRSRKRPGGAVTTALALLLTPVLIGGCRGVIPVHVPRPAEVRELSAQVDVHGEALTLHLASPRTPPSASTPLVLYASGDGGWFGAAVGMFHTIAASGLPTAGFSTKAFMRIERRWSKPLSVAHVAEGYQRIIDAARAQLRLPPDAPVVLTGWSRGASLGLLVASSREVDRHVIGLVAIGLAADEQLDIDGGSDEDAGEGGEAPAAVSDDLNGRSIAMYPLLSQIAPRRVVVIQASGDSYLPGARARELFGADSTTSRLVIVDARNHRFNGGESAFAAALTSAVGWVNQSPITDHSSRIPNRESLIPNPESLCNRIPDPESRIPDPKSLIPAPDPESLIE
jgi:hypothetical protein